MKISILSAGTINTLGMNVDETYVALKSNKSGLKPLTSFKTKIPSVPAGEVDKSFNQSIPRSHSLALHAVNEAIEGIEIQPEAIVIGITTGGIDVTEKVIKSKEINSENLMYHGNGTIAELIAKKFGNSVPIITISTACSSGTVALGIGFNLLRTGSFKNVLVGGVDSICKLTYHGFNALQLIDEKGSKPLDVERNGLSIAEGSAMLLLSSEENKNSIGEIRGYGLTCDAYHPASPHPEGLGAYTAMKAALDQANLKPEDIDYINLHGTGTIENDKSEAMAIQKLFTKKMPHLSSVKGATGHTLGAAGAIEAVISTIAINKGFIPANTGCKSIDETLKIQPNLEPIDFKVDNVISNSFGFGGNNASMVFSKNSDNHNSISTLTIEPFSIIDASCITGSGFLAETIDALDKGEACQGLLDKKIISNDLPKKEIRRVKRLSRMALALGASILENTDHKLHSIFLGTAWGSLTETYDFISKLYSSDEQLSSPTDFVGSVHNAPAGQLAIRYKAEGKNITTTGADASFDQALYTTSLLTENSNETILVCGVDEYHEELSPSLDPSTEISDIKSDGGGALLLSQKNISPIKIVPISLRYIIDSIQNSLNDCNNYKNIIKNAGAIFIGSPYQYKETNEKHSKYFIDYFNFSGAIINYREHLGEYAATSAVAASLAYTYLKRGNIPASMISSGSYKKDQPIILLNMGSQISISILYKE